MQRKVSEIMEQDLITVELTDSLKEVLTIFNQIKIRHIPVVTAGSLVGMISHFDVLKVDQINKIFIKDKSVEHLDLPDISLKRIMAHNPTTIQADKTVLEAVEIFSKSMFHALPVMKDTVLVGIVTTTDIMKLLLSQSKS